MSSDEEKKEEEADEGAVEGGGGGRSLSEQRALRLRRRRGGSGAGKDRRRGGREAVDSGADAAPPDAAAAAADETERGGGENGEAEGYTTAYNAIRKKYPHHVSMMERGDGGGLSRALQYQNHHGRERTSREARGVKLIGQRWKSQLDQGSIITPQKRNIRRRIYEYQSDSSDEESNGAADDDAIEQQETMQPTLVYRRTDDDHSKHITFLNDQTILSVDDRSHLQIIGLPLSTSDEKGRDGYANGGNPLGVGKLPARTSTIPELPCDKPLPHSYELFGYQNGDRFAIGLPGGRMQLFATEKMDGDGWVTNRWRADNPAHVVLSCLAFHRPHRRYGRVEVSTYQPASFSLASMLSLDTRDMLEKFDAIDTIQEVYRYDPLDFPGLDARWAFREGGVGGGSGTALLGACIDYHSDCFSLRVIDERVCGGGPSPEAASQILVDASGQDSDDVTSICFSGEYGMVTSHERWRGTKERWPPAPRGAPTESIIKWWDHRMLREQPVAATILPPFPRDGVSGVSSDPEYSLGGYTCAEEHCDGGNTCACEQMNARPFDSNGPPPGSRETIKLIGARDCSDHVAILSSGRLRQVLLVDSSRREVVRREMLPGTGFGPRPNFWVSCSRNLDFLACYELSERRDFVNQPAPDPISIYDISRHKYRNSTGNCASGEKRRSDCLNADDAAPGEENGGLLGRVRPKFPDMYGLESQLSCIALNEFGTQLACGTKDGDIFVLEPEQSTED